MVKRNILSTLLIVFGMSTFAKADFAIPVWDCQLVSTVSGVSIAVGPSISFARGRGVVKCSSVNGEYISRPVSVELFGLGGGLGFTRIDNLNIKAFSAGLAATSDMFGTMRLSEKVNFTMLTDGGSIGTYQALNGRGVSAGVEFSGYKGYGLELNAEVQGFSITPIDPN